MSRRDRQPRRQTFYKVVISVVIEGDLASGVFFVWADSPEEAGSLIRKYGPSFQTTDIIGPFT